MAGDGLHFTKIVVWNGATVAWQVRAGGPAGLVLGTVTEEGGGWKGYRHGGRQATRAEVPQPRPGGRLAGIDRAEASLAPVAVEREPCFVTNVDTKPLWVLIKQ